ncbi:uncharacterized protein ARMOST_15523 [Armillaria ostoyae]|uniref:Uncharacterized protein n=1 Tax=Armillaria ostoyae TaxID=47428 RepID=A0A284RTR3_ARMOS|nr:uncharacterized protein ARMOST_15523 [Armillaria ostoyae]
MKVETHSEELQNRVTVSPSEADWDGSQPIVLEPLKKGWAKGSQDMFLDERLPHFIFFHNQGPTPTKEHTMIILNDYYAVYYWRDPVTKEPTSKPLPPHLEVLSPYDKALKAAKLAQMNTAIYNWLDYWWKHPKATRSIEFSPATSSLPLHQKKSSSVDPLHLLLCNIVGIKTSRTRANTAVERWAKDHHEELKPEMQQKVGDAGRGKIGSSLVFMRERFAAQSRTVQKKYEELPKEEGLLACDALAQAKADASKPLDPSESQCIIDELPEMLALFLNKLGTMLNMHVSFYLAGLEPRKGGQINVISMHAGYDHSPKPMIFPEVRPKSYQKVIKLFEDWVETCYDEDERNSRALPCGEADDDEDDVSVLDMSVDEVGETTKCKHGSVDNEGDDGATARPEDTMLPLPHKKKRTKKWEKENDKVSAKKTKTGKQKESKEASPVNINATAIALTDVSNNAPAMHGSSEPSYVAPIPIDPVMSLDFRGNGNTNSGTRLGN